MSLGFEIPPDDIINRNRRERVFEWLCVSATWFGVVVLGMLLIGTAVQSIGWLDWQFLSSWASRTPEKAGLLAPLWGSFWLMTLTGLFSVPIGVGAAVYLEEYSKDSLGRRLIQVNLSNLAGVPSIVYGILGSSVFVKMFGLFGAHTKTLVIGLGVANLEIPLPFGRCVLSGALTLTLLVLPVIIVAAQEALRSIPPSIRHASLALGATRWQTVRHQVIPAALPGIMTGVILAISRAMGETAPLIMIGATTYIAFAPGRIDSPDDFFTNPQGLLKAPFDTFTALPIQVYNWISQSKAGFQNVSAAGIIVLLLALLSLNSVAIFVRYRIQKKLKW